jgi:hypothetical protein
VRSISLRLGQQVAIRFSPFSFIKEHDSNRKHSRILQLSAIESSALLVTRLQHVRSIVLRSLHRATRDEIPPSVTPLHLLSPTFKRRALAMTLNPHQEDQLYKELTEGKSCNALVSSIQVCSQSWPGSYVYLIDVYVAR